MHFSWYNRKNSAYLAQKELDSELNRKISAYFSLAAGAGSLIKDEIYWIGHYFILLPFPIALTVWKNG